VCVKGDRGALIIAIPVIEIKKPLQEERNVTVMERGVRGMKYRQGRTPAN